MKLVRFVIMVLCFAAAVQAVAEDRWLHVFRTEQGRQRVSAFPLEDLDESTFCENNSDHSVGTMFMTGIDGSCSQIDLCTVDSCVIGTNIPTLYIDIAGGAEVEDKENWLDATIRMRGYGSIDDLGEAQVTMRGRGNSTWNYPKKPYRVKFNQKTEIGCLNKTKNFVLLANYIDNTLMRNVVALKIAQLMGMEYTNHFEPVNLVVNGTYRGAYLMTEKVGINSGSVNIDENTGILFEIDSNYDEDFKFRSEVFDLPVMVKDPDFNDLADGEGKPSTDDMLESWRQDFQKLENSVARLSSVRYKNYLDMQSVVDFLIVNCVCANREINHPKSVYLYKKKLSGKYYFGPIWDFDWAFTFDANTEGSVPYNRVLFTTTDRGAKFFRAIVDDADFVWKYFERWRFFRDQVWPRVLQFMDEYAQSIYVSALQNGECWPQESLMRPGFCSTENFWQNYTVLRQWLVDRIDYLDTATHMGLY